MSRPHLGIVAAALMCISATTCSEARGDEGRKDEGLISKMDYVAVSPDKVDSANEGKLVFVQGKVTGAQSFNDPDWEVSAKGLVLRREVSEVVLGTSSGRYSTATPTKVTRIRQPRTDIPGPFFFKESMGTVRLGAYTLSPELLRLCADGWKKIPIRNIDKLPAGKFCKLSKQDLTEEDTRCWANYNGEDANKPKMIVQFGILPDSGEATVLAMQSGDKLVPARMDGGTLRTIDEQEALDEETQITGQMLGVYTHGKKPIEEVREKAAAAEQEGADYQTPGWFGYVFIGIVVIFGVAFIGLMYAAIQPLKAFFAAHPESTTKRPPPDPPMQ